jgi:hypothetical protein
MCIVSPDTTLLLHPFKNVTIIFLKSLIVKNEGYKMVAVKIKHVQNQPGFYHQEIH